MASIMVAMGTNDEPPPRHYISIVAAKINGKA